MKLVAEPVWTWIFGRYKRGMLDPVTSFMVDGAWFHDAWKKGRWDGRKRLVQYHLGRRQFYFPTGLLDGVCRFLSEQGTPYILEEARPVPEEVEPCYSLNDFRKGRIRLDEGRFAYQAEAVDEALIRGRGVLQCATGAGKTEIGAAVIKSLDKQTVWFTHRTSLLYQTHRRLKERLEQPIGIIGDGRADYEKVTVAMVQTCSNRDHDAFLKGCQVVIGDEVHHLESDSWYANFAAVQAPWRFGLTATPRLEKEGMYLLAMTGRVIYRITATELIERGVLVPPKVWVAQVDQPKFHRDDKWDKIYKFGVVENPVRNQLTAQIARTFADQGKPPLVLVHRIKHADLLSQEFSALGVTNEIIKGSVSQDKRERAFEDLWAGRLGAVIAVASTVGEGCDFPQLKAIINATGTRGGGNASEGETGRATIQIFGRGLRHHEGKSSVDYVDFADTGHRSLKKASLARLGTLKEEGYGPKVQRWEKYKNS